MNCEQMLRMHRYLLDRYPPEVSEKLRVVTGNLLECEKYLAKFVHESYTQGF